MIKNTKIIKIHEKEMISFNDDTQLFLIDGFDVHNLNYKAIILGVIQNKIILFVENSYVIFVDFPSFLPGPILYKGEIDSYANSDTAIWLQSKNKVFRIESDMNLTLYDEFDTVTLCGFVYLLELNTLAYFVQDDEGSKIFFSDYNIPTLSLPNIFSIPELFFESHWCIIFFVGRTILEYDLLQKKLKVLNKTNPIKFNWKSLQLTLDYQIILTEVTIKTEIESKISQIEGDVWKVINTGNTIYLFSSTINTPIFIHTISADGCIKLIYHKPHFAHQVKMVDVCQKSYPLLGLFSEDHCNKATAIFFIHGGPHQKAGNIWDPFINAFLNNGYSVYVPQYKGTIGIDEIETPLYGEDDFESLVPHHNKVKQIHDKVIIVGHSYGAFLALKLYMRGFVDILVGINGVYDLLTISHLNPKTYAHVDQDTKISLSPKYSSMHKEKRCEWHHIQFETDPLIKKSDLKNSLNIVGGKGPKIHYMSFFGHGIFNEFQSATIVQKIKLIEDQFYNNIY